MTKFFFLIALSSLFIFSSCSKNEIVVDDEVLIETNELQFISIDETTGNNSDFVKAEFTIDNANSEVNEKATLLLTNKSENAVSYLWDFGNGDTSTEANPNYTYKNHGIYTVKLTVTDRHDRVEVSSNNITVFCLYADQNHDNN